MKTKFLSAVAISALLFVSCNNDDNETPEINDGRVRFSSGIEAASMLKVNGGDGDIWSTLDRIGIYMVENGKALTAENIVESAENVEHKAMEAKQKTEFSPVSTAIYYPQDNSKVDFIAYYPYQTSFTDFIYPINLKNQQEQTDIDFMIAERANNAGLGYDKTNTTPINLIFNHQLVKVMINIEKGAGVTDLTGLNIDIKGMNTEADFSISNLGLTNERGLENITPRRTHSIYYTYEAILLPVSLDANHVVEFTIDNNKYKWTMNNNSANIDKLEAGKKYTFNVKLQRKKVEVSATINKWEPVGAVNVTAE